MNFSDRKFDRPKVFDFNVRVEFIGKFEAKHYTIATFYVTKDQDSGCLLSAESAQDLKLISFHLNKVTTPEKQEVQTVNIDTKDEKIRGIVDRHTEVFMIIGKFKDHCITLNIDKEVIPVAQPQSGSYPTMVHSLVTVLYNNVRKSVFFRENDREFSL